MAENKAVFLLNVMQPNQSYCCTVNQRPAVFLLANLARQSGMFPICSSWFKEPTENAFCWKVEGEI